MRRKRNKAKRSEKKNTKVKRSKRKNLGSEKKRKHLWDFFAWKRNEKLDAN
jgi:hypothetical protein